MAEKPAQLPNSSKEEDYSEKEDDGLDTPIDCWRCRKDACRNCCFSINNYWKSLIWLAIIFAYLLLGGLFFSLAERPAELARTAEAAAAKVALQMERDQLVQVIVNNSNLTEEQTIVFLDGFANASERLNEALAATETVQVWDFASAVFFCVTVVTTIGYGTIAPTTGSGQALFIFYALLGIPLALTFLATIGNIMTDYLDAALKPLLNRFKDKKKNNVLIKGIGILVFLTLALVFMIFIPAAIFYASEDWTYGQSIYFCFVTLTTVGFGDFVPAVAGSSRQDSNSPAIGIYKIMVSVWLWIGLAFVAAIITELTNFIDAVSKKIRDAQCCSRGRGEDTEKQELTDVATPPVSPTTPTDTAESAQKLTTDAEVPPEKTAESADTN